MMRLSKRCMAAILTMCGVCFGTTLAYGQVNKGILGHSNSRDSGYVQLRGNSDETIVYLGSVDENGDNRDYGNLQLKDGTGSGGLTRARLYVPDGRGILLMEDSTDELRVNLRSSLRGYGAGGSDSYGVLLLNGDPGDGNLVHLGGSTDEPRQGQLRLRNSSDGLTRIHAGMDNDNNGFFRVFNSDQSVRSVQLSSDGEGGNVRVRSFSNSTVGSFRAVESGGQECGQLYLTGTGGNSVLIDGCQGVKNSVMAHPSKKKQQIFYAAMEGAEVGLYTRGTARLSNGRAKIKFPEHFAGVVSGENLTVQLTPHSADTLGLAAVKISPRGLGVAELGGDKAKGNFEFSYSVNGIKRGSENYPVVRPALKLESGKDTDKVKEPSAEAREDVKETESNVDETSSKQG